MVQYPPQLLNGHRLLPPKVHHAMARRAENGEVRGAWILNALGQGSEMVDVDHLGVFRPVRICDHRVAGLACEWSPRPV
jgi:hypothetical protein